MLLNQLSVADKQVLFLGAREEKNPHTQKSI